MSKKPPIRKKHHASRIYDCWVLENQGLRESMDVNHRLNFDVHRAVHRNIISIIKPTRCTNVSNVFYFGMTIYVFRTVFPSVIRRSRLYIQQQAFVKQILLYCRYPLASRQQYLFDKCLLL